ncbi:MAG: hypothetical protein V1678_00015 [Candidatus Aenigmatarchaeota archaeon]
MNKVFLLILILSACLTNMAYGQGTIGISGRLVDSNGSPVQMTLIVGNVSNSTDAVGNYSLNVDPGVYDLNYSLPNMWMRLPSFNLTSDVKDMISNVTIATNRTSFFLDVSDSQTVQVYSPRKPVRILMNGTEIAEVGSLPELNASTWYYSEGVVYISSSGNFVQPNTFTIRGTSMTIEVLTPTARNYYHNAWQLLKEVDANAIRVSGGIEGDVAHLNMINYPNEWAQNLDYFLSTAAQNGFKVYFSSLGTAYGTLFGIVSPGDTAIGPFASTSITQAKTMIGKLAGNNSLNHNFITDPRVLGWVTSNEDDIFNSTVLNWNLELCDYIRSLGGKAWLGQPVYNGVFDDWAIIEPILRGHMDMMDVHIGAAGAFYNDPTYTAFYNLYYNALYNHVIRNRGNFTLDQIILSEFGIWRGIGAGNGLDNITFTDLDRQTYYKSVFDSAKNTNIKNIMFLSFFSRINSDGSYLTPNYGVVDTDGTFFPYLHDIIQSAYST